MKYRKILNLVSRSIFDLSNSKSQPLRDILSSRSVASMVIYQRNLLGRGIKLLAMDFPVTKKYLGDQNFNFFVRKFLLDRQIKSPNIVEISPLFLSFLVEHYEIHQDEIVEYIASLDLFWSQNNEFCKELALPQGIGLFWERLGNGKNCDKVVINLNTVEKVHLIVNGEEKKLMLIER